MVINGKTFDGGKHTISNLNMSEYLLNQQATTFTPEACIGLFAAVYGNAIIKDIALDGVTIEPSAENLQWWFISGLLQRNWHNLYQLYG